MRTKKAVFALVAIVMVAALLLLFAKHNQIASAKAEFVKEQIRLADIVRNDSDVERRMNTVGKIKDQRLLAEFASDTNQHWWVRSVALHYLKDQAVLARIAKYDEDNNVRNCAFQNLTDRALLQNIVKNSSHLWARAHAAEKLNDTALAEEINKQIRERRRKEEEIKRVIMTIEYTDNQAFLREVLEKTPSTNGWEVVRQAAEKRLDELTK